MWQLRVRPHHSGVTFCVGIQRGAYFLSPGGGAGTAAVRWHFPLPVLPPVSRPAASRWVPVNDPEGLAFVVWLPVSRPEASRYWVLVPEPW